MGVAPHSNRVFAEDEVAEGDVFVDYQNYNHGYCPYCDSSPCRCANRNSGPIAPPTPPTPPPPPPAQTCPGPGCPAPVPPPQDPPPQDPPPQDPPPQDPPPASACAPTSACAPCTAPVCGTECGISICALGIGIAALVTAAVIIVSSGNGSSSHH